MARCSIVADSCCLVLSSSGPKCALMAKASIVLTALLSSPAAARSSAIPAMRGIGESELKRCAEYRDAVIGVAEQIGELTGSLQS